MVDGDGDPEGFLEGCRAALVAARIDQLFEYSTGSAAHVKAIDKDLGSGGRARAIAHLALALSAELEERERGAHLGESLELWTPEGGAMPAEIPGSLAPGAAVDALGRICRGEHRLRLEGLHDVALALSGSSPREGRRATTLVPVVVSESSLLLVIEARRFDGLLPGVFEIPEAALADRDAGWRRMESVVDELILRQSGLHAVRYSVRDNSDGELHLDRLKGESAGMALAVVSRQVVGRRSLRLDGHTAIAAAVDADGNALEVKGMAQKLALKKPSADKPDVDHLEARVLRLLVEKEHEKRLRPDGGPDQKENREVVVQADIDVVPIANLDEAMRRARLRLRRPVVTAMAVSLIVAAAIAFALTHGGTDPGVERRVAESELPGKVDAAVRRLGDDPDRAALLRAEEATVQPSASSLAALFAADQGVSKRIMTFRPEDGIASDLELAEGHRLVITGGANGEVGVWDGNTRKEEVLQRNALEDEARMIATADNGRLIAVAGDDSVLLAERSSTGLVVEIEEGLSAGASAVAFSADGKTLYAGTEDLFGSSYLVDGSWTPIEWISVDSGGHYVRDIFPLDPEHVAYCVETTGNDQALRVLDLGSYATQPVRDAAGHPVPCPAAELRPGVIATTHGPDYREVTIGRLDGARWHQVGHRHLAEELRVLGEVPGGRLFYVAGDAKVTTLTEKGEIVAGAPLGPSDHGIAVGQGGRSFAVIDGDGSIQVESLESEDPLTRRLSLLDSRSFGWAVDWSANGERLAVGTQEGDVEIFDPNDPGAGPLISRNVFPGMIRAVEVDPLGRWVWAAGDTGQVARVDARDPSAEIKYSIPLGEPIRDLELSPDGKQLAIAGVPGVGVIIMHPDLEGFERGEAEDIDALGLAWLDNKRLLVSSGIDEGDRSEAVLRVLNARDEPLGAATPTVDPGMVAVRVHGDRAAAVGFDGQVELFDVAGDTPRLLRRASTENELATDVAWSPHGEMLAVVGKGGEVTFVQAKTLQLIGKRPLGNTGGGTALAAHGETLGTLVAGQATVKLIPFGAPAWSQQICNRTQQFLSPADWIELAGPWPPYQRPCRPPE
jgi:WD40 repeat protein